jgi:ferritin
MLSKSIVEKLNAQINLEQYSSNLYLQMSAWCEDKGYEGCGEFLRVHAAEESMHMHKLFQYVIEAGAMPVLGAIEAPPIAYESLADVFEKTYKHELMVTKSINNLVDAAFTEKDFSTFQFLQWYVGEQHEEEHLFQTILDKIRIIGIEGKGIYFLDKEIRKLAAPKA